MEAPGSSRTGWPRLGKFFGRAGRREAWFVFPGGPPGPGLGLFVRRAGRREEVAYGVLFLASDEASYITGTELMGDGGFTAR